MTIRLRLTLFWAAVLTIVVLISGCTVVVLFEREQWGHLDGSLMEEADTIAASIAHANSRAAADIIDQLSSERDLGPARRVQLIAGPRVLADAGSPTADLPWISHIPPAGTVLDGSRGRFRFALMPIAGRPGAYLVDGVDAAPIRESIYRLKLNLIITVPLILALSIVWGYWLAGRALAPISGFVAALAEIDPRDLRSRLPLGKGEDEVARLTRAINALLERVERSAETERRFAADAAHELRTPLAILRSGLEVTLSRERSAAEYAKALAAAHRETIALCGTADALLALARLDHEATIAREPVALDDLLREVVSAVEPLLESKRLQLRENIDADVVVNANRDHLRRLVVNLLDNALKFTPECGAIRVDLAAANGRATISIADSGPGIPAAELPYIFERFFRGKLPGQPGSGLGLSLCQEIAHLHGGEIRAANPAAGGAEFVVSLPVVKVQKP